MFDIGFPELVLIAIVGLLVIGPERLPEALRTMGLWIGRMRRSFTNVKTELEREIGMDEIRRQLHNEAVMEELKRIERDVRHSVDQGAAGPTGPEGAENQIAPPAKVGVEDQDGAAAEVRQEAVRQEAEEVRQEAAEVPQEAEGERRG